MAKRAQSQTRDTQTDLEEKVRQIFEAAKWEELDREPRRGLTSDLWVARTDLGMRRRYGIQCVLEITSSKVREHHARLLNYVRQSKQPFRDFDEYWVVGHYSPDYGEETVPETPQYDRHFRVLDLKELKTLLKPSRQGAGSARTKIGKAVQTNGPAIQVAITALSLQLQEALDRLRHERPNSDDAKAKVSARVSEYENILAQLESIRTTVTEYTKGTEREKAVVEKVATFKSAIQSWWLKGHERIINTTSDAAIFVGAAGLLHVMQADTSVALAIAGAVVGGDRVAKCLKALPRKLF